MAYGYKTDDEQIEELKKWWRENGSSTLFGIALALLVVFGWQTWQERSQTQTEAASLAFQNLISTAMQANSGLTEEQLTSARFIVDQIKQEHGDSVYALFAALYSAKFAVVEGDLVRAANELQWVLNQSPPRDIHLLARLRLARVYYAQGQYDQALEQLDYTDPGSYATAYAELRGDIHQARGEPDKALAAYQKASDLAAELEFPVNNPVLRMKLQDLKPAAESEAVAQAGE